MKPKYILSVLILAVEAFAIFWLFLTTCKDDVKHMAKVIQVPENMVLTTANDICFSVDREKEITVPEGTKITPDYIFPKSVSFSYDGYHHISADYNDFVEQAKLEELENIALQDRVNRQKEHVLKGAVFGICAGICWLLLGIAITHLLIKKAAISILIVVHGIIFVLFVFGGLLFFPGYLSS